MLNQEKCSLEMVAKLCDILTCPCFVPSKLWGSLEDSSPIVSAPGYGGSRADLRILLCIYVVTCLEATWKTDTRHSSVLPNSQLTQAREANCTSGKDLFSRMYKVFLQFNNKR